MAVETPDAIIRVRDVTVQFGSTKVLDRLSLDVRYRRETESRIADVVGMEIPFDDCHVERYDQNLAWSSHQFRALEQRVEALAGQVPTPLALSSSISSSPLKSSQPTVFPPS